MNIVNKYFTFLHLYLIFWFKDLYLKPQFKNKMDKNLKPVNEIIDVYVLDMNNNQIN